MEWEIERSLLTNKVVIVLKEGCLRNNESTDNKHRGQYSFIDFMFYHCDRFQPTCRYLPCHKTSFRTQIGNVPPRNKTPTKVDNIYS